MRWLAALLLALLATRPALAQLSQPNYSGMRCSISSGGNPCTNSPATAVTGTTVTFRIPYMVAVYPGGSATEQLDLWTGVQTISGASDLIQPIIAVNLNEATGASTIGAVYEVYTSGTLIGAGEFTAVQLKMGDVITIDVLCTANCTPHAAGMLWSLTVIDVTKGQSQTITGVPGVNGLAEADYVSEAPGVSFGSSASIVPRYGSVPFVSAKVNGLSVGFVSRAQNGFVATNFDGNNVNQNVSDPSSAGDGFNTCWGVGSTQTTCPAWGTVSFDKGQSFGGF